jgi:long-chain acyl-CoA synthetase
LPGLEVRIVDDEGDPATDGDPGEIELRGPNLFSGYWPGGVDGPGPGGWWRTGDIAYVDAAGDLHLVDRRRDLVLVSGFNVYPYEVETVISTHPDVAEAAVIGVPDPRTGSKVKAFVVALPGHEISVDAIAEHCRTRLARFKCPTEIEVVPSLPHSSTGKVMRARLRDGLTGD